MPQRIRAAIEADQIGAVAQGIVMGRYGVDESKALLVIHAIARSLHVHPAALATRIVQDHEARVVEMDPKPPTSPA